MDLQATEGTTLAKPTIEQIAEGLFRARAEGEKIALPAAELRLADA